MIGRSISHYRVIEKIGAGGMGEVYRARDTRLDRDVAIKALPAEFATDPERLARFEREAKVLASLSHPNLAGIYGVEESEGRRYLALEFVEGDTLAARLARGPLPLDETIAICLQIASAMEAAHESGVIHRDLKPGNVMITPGDHVKVVDFGLAKGKVSEREPGSAESPTMTESPALQHSPTVATPATLPGVILGTASYLSPEQARGKTVDRRTDIWSFGCVLYECLTGRRAFDGETVSDLVAGILRGDVEWSRLPKETPPRVVELLQHCLEKDPKRRLRDMGDARITLEDVSASLVTGRARTEQPSPRPRMLTPRRVLLVAFIALAGAAVGIAAWNSINPADGNRAAAARRVVKFGVEIPPGLRFYWWLLSPNGEEVLVTARRTDEATGRASRYSVYRRRLDQDAFVRIEGTEGADHLAYGPDGKWLYFTLPIEENSARRRLFRMPADGTAPPVDVCDWRPEWGAPVCLESGDVLAQVLDGLSLVRISSTTGDSTGTIPLKIEGFSGWFVHQFHPLPGDRGVLLSSYVSAQGGIDQGTAVLDLKSGKVKKLIENGGSARYFESGQLLFSRRDVIFAVPFDLKRLEVTGKPIPVLKGAYSYPNQLQNDHAEFELSADGSLLFPPGGAVGSRRRAILVGRDGTVRDWSGEERAFRGKPAISPDRQCLASTILDPDGRAAIWLSDRNRPTMRPLVSVPGASCEAPVWSPDGRQVAYRRWDRSDQDGVYVISRGGGERPSRLTKDPSPLAYGLPTSWAPDGSSLLLTGWTTSNDIYVVSVNAHADSLAEPRLLITGPADEGSAVFSPDGKWIAYRSNESGQAEVYIRAYGLRGDVGPAIRISSGGANSPMWGRNSARLYYATLDRKICLVSLQRSPRFSISTPTPVWDLQDLKIALGGFTLDADENLLGIRVGEDEDTPINYRLELVLNFKEEVDAAVRRSREK